MAEILLFLGAALFMFIALIYLPSWLKWRNKYDMWYRPRKTDQH